VENSEVGGERGGEFLALLIPGESEDVGLSEVTRYIYADRIKSWAHGDPTIVDVCLLE